MNSNLEKKIDNRRNHRIAAGVILIFFGAKKIPELAQGLGKGIREFRKAARDIQDDVEKEIKQIDKPSEEKNPKQ